MTLAAPTAPPPACGSSSGPSSVEAHADHLDDDGCEASANATVDIVPKDLVGIAR